MPESSTPLWLKVMAVLTATALGGGYVAYRKANADKAIQTRQSSPPAQQAGTGDTPPGETPAGDRTVMSGSKSEFGAATIGEVPVLQEIFSSSKSGKIVTPDMSGFWLDDPLMGSSKSAPIFPPKKEPAAEPEKNPRILLPGSKSIIDPVFSKKPLPEEP